MKTIKDLRDAIKDSNDDDKLFIHLFTHNSADDTPNYIDATNIDMVVDKGELRFYAYPN